MNLPCAGSLQPGEIASNANTPVDSSYRPYVSIPQLSRVAYSANPQVAPPLIYTGQTAMTPTQSSSLSTSLGTGSIHDVVSNHSLQWNMRKDAIPTFMEDSMHYWSWVTNVSAYVMETAFTPLRTLRLLMSRKIWDPGKETQVLVSWVYCNSGGPVSSGTVRPFRSRSRRAQRFLCDQSLI